MPTRCFATLLPLVIGLAACQRKGPCAKYDRTAEAQKESAFIRYCVDRQGRAVGPYTCERNDGRGSVEGQFIDAKRHGTWVFRADKSTIVRIEKWLNDRKLSEEKRHPLLPALPEDLLRVDCDGYFIRKAPEPPPKGGADPALPTAVVPMPGIAPEPAVPTK